EEEKEMMLASLEARFQRMLIVETQIHEGTTALVAVPQKDWLELSYGRCRELAERQQKLFESAKDLEKQGRVGAGG
ncbi:MAG: hypothetical protein ACK5EN_21430, partial [Planctomyces sp.]